MRGGARPGAGRKPGEPTVRVRVPQSLLGAVSALIEAHKKGGSVINESPVLDNGPKTIEASPVALVVPTLDLAERQKPAKPSGEGVEEVATPLNAEQRRAMRELEKLPKFALKQVRAKFGSLTEAVRQGARLNWHAKAVEIRPELAESKIKRRNP